MTPALSVGIISPDLEVRTMVEEAVHAVTGHCVFSSNQYPETEVLKRLLDTGVECVLFLDFQDFASGVRITQAVKHIAVPPTIVALNIGNTREELLTLMQAGINEVLDTPLSGSEALAILQRLSRPASLGPVTPAASGEVYAFLPAKAGSGATTISTYCAAALARLSGAHTLLLDFDIRLGVTSFLLKVNSNFSVMDALEQVSWLDDDLWAKLIFERGLLHILGSAPSEVERTVPAGSFEALIAYAKQRYGALCIDLPGTMNPHEAATLRQSSEIFLVCTPDVTCLHMARKRVDLLDSMHLLDRVSVIVNRIDRRNSISVRNVEEILGRPVRFSIPSDEKTIAKAVQEGIAVEGSSAISRSLETLARSLRTNPQHRPGVRSRTFVEYFSLSWARGADPHREHIRG